MVFIVCKLAYLGVRWQPLLWEHELDEPVCIGAMHGSKQLACSSSMTIAVGCGWLRYVLA